MKMMVKDVAIGIVGLEVGRKRIRCMEEEDFTKEEMRKAKMFQKKDRAWV